MPSIKGNSVKFSKVEVEAFKRRWPGSRMPDRAVTFVMDSTGDLVDILPYSYRYDGSDLAALSEDAKDILRRRGNPGGKRSKGSGWIPAKAFRITNSGAVQVKVARGRVVRNPFARSLGRRLTDKDRALFVKNDQDMYSKWKRGMSHNSITKFVRNNRKLIDNYIMRQSGDWPPL